MKSKPPEPSDKPKRPLCVHCGMNQGFHHNKTLACVSGDWGWHATNKFTPKEDKPE